MVSSEWLKKTELFEDLTDPQLDALLSQSMVKSFSAGETIFQQGEEADQLYILIEGEIDLIVKVHEEIGLMTSRIDKEGAVFGMPSLIEPYHYNVTAKSLKPSEVLSIRADYLKIKMDEDPKMGMAIMKKLAFIYFNRLNELRSGVSHLLKTFKVRTP